MLIKMGKWHVSIVEVYVTEFPQGAYSSHMTHFVFVKYNVSVT